MNDMNGKFIERYHILEQLGQGGMATVYKAYDTRLERDVAIKLIRKDAFPVEVHDRVLQRFDREAKSLAKLSHPNIVKVYDYGEYEGAPFLVMELIDGGSLKEYTGQPIPYQDAVQILLPIARALSYAHERKILHRDIKPGNILISESGEPILTDFGIAKLLDNSDGQTLTGTNVGVGTPEYMAPEQGLGKEVDGRADIYSLGIVLYELLTGTKPYQADTPFAVLLKQVNDPIPRPKQEINDLPVEVEKIIIKALSKEPENRYQNMTELIQILEKTFSAKIPPSVKLFKNIKNNSGEDLQENERTIDDISQTITGKRNNKKGFLILLSIVALILFSLFVFKAFLQKRLFPPAALSTVSQEIIENEEKTLIPTFSVTDISPLAMQEESTPESFGKLIFEEDFEDGTADDFEIQYGTFYIPKLKDGNHVWRITTPGTALLILPEDVNDYVVEAKIMQITTGEGFAFIEARIEDGEPCNSNYGTYLDFYNDWVNLVERESDCSENRKNGLFDYANESLFFNQWYTVRMEINGNRAKVYLDGELVAHAIDTSSFRESNRIAISTCCDDLMPFMFYYDDIKVWTIE